MRGDLSESGTRSRRRNAEPAIEKTSLRLRRDLIRRNGIYKTIIICQQTGFFQTRSRSILPQVAGIENPARELIEFFVLDGSQETHADLGDFRNLFERNALLLTLRGEIERARNRGSLGQRLSCSSCHASYQVKIINFNTNPFRGAMGIRGKAQDTLRQQLVQLECVRGGVLRMFDLELRIKIFPPSPEPHPRGADRLADLLTRKK